MDNNDSQSNEDLTYTRRRRRGSCRFTRVKSGRGRDKANAGTGIGGWKGRRGLGCRSEVSSSQPERNPALLLSEKEVNSSHIPESFGTLQGKQVKASSPYPESIKKWMFCDETMPEYASKSVKDKSHDAQPHQLQDMPSVIRPLSPKTIVHSHANGNPLWPDMDEDFFVKAVATINSQLPQNWTCLRSPSGFSAFLLSSGAIKSIQRQIVLQYDGTKQIIVHCKLLGNQLLEEVIFKHYEQISPLSKLNGHLFVECIVSAVKKLHIMEVCAGVMDADFQILWEVDSHGYIDPNPYQEHRYSKTYRSLTCLFLVSQNKWKCSNCSKLQNILRKKALAHNAGVKLYTSNIYLTDHEKLNKLQKQQALLKRMKSKVKWLQTKLQCSVQNDSNSVDKDIMDFFWEVSLLNVDHI